MPDHQALLTGLVGDRAAGWDVSGELPRDLLVRLGAEGLLCAEVEAGYGGLGLGSRGNGELTAHVGSLCSSLRSVMTSQGMAAWTVLRIGGTAQRETYLKELTSGKLAAVGFSERQAGSDLSAIRTRVRIEGDTAVVDGHKVWTTAAAYADHLVVFGLQEDGSGAVVVVPSDTAGLRVERVPNPSGCRAAGHAHLYFDGVRVPADAVLAGSGASLPMLVAVSLAYGRTSVAWGCLGILRACTAAATAHAKSREQFGQPLAGHQLVAGHLADLWTAEQIAARVCEHASDLWDEGSPEAVTATVLAKHVAAERAAAGAALAAQILASAGAIEGHVVERAYRDAKLMEIIEGSSEMSRMMLARHALALPA
ncbi:MULTISPECIES: acyl-CoA dehydrogenase family protein [Streptomyces]|uniref:Acyl-CoA dehydrogenase n=3 Tax=Streptomyces TaxID=1883 RepID=I2MTV5_STRT9|nr:MULTISPECIES: acyl-CoA dehydrogenase family protein [Streptomyces]ADU56317.1 acyl-CoA dehydrogenase [Streptomyces sp. KCTC 11604BP]ADX99519.1 FkbI [Streptomyces sp. MJM7001]AZK92757.1 acyl-CoA dehydrogenase [Streptomyces tsukubensis]EIF88202.1 methoxymalonate biosynthesis protein [Streptomyces tsukubensis NRRL18488]MYS65484.1 acyl-CoA dehydrogenase [Streptomyces sp. SID5473]